MLALILVDPATTEFGRWATDLAAQLSSYNAPNPWTEDLWVPWAEQICTLDVLAELGVADPRGFSDWRSWAAAFLSAVA